MLQKLKFIQQEIFYREEGKYVEFKTIDSEKPVRTIVCHAEEYIIGFLNAAVEGDLYLGINDSGEIIGITISRSQRDEIQKNITDKLSNINPVIPPSCYDVDIHCVHNGEGKQSESLCIVQIHVSQIEEDYLYKTSNGTYWLYETKGGSNYLKKASSCIKLNHQQVAQEIIYRSQKHLRKELEDINEKLAKEPENQSILWEKVKIAKLMGDIQTMDETYKKLIYLNPKSYKTRVAYASAYENMGDFEVALSILNDALQVDEHNTDVLKKQGSIFLMSHRADQKC